MEIVIKRVNIGEVG